MLSYSAIVSLDGYTNDEEGKFGWGAPDEEVLAFINDLERPVSTYLYGRRMYEVMRYWENVDLAGQPAAARDFAGIWRSADKIVYSTTLPEISTARTRIEGSFDPEAVRTFKQHGAVSIGGPTLASHAIRAGLVDEYQLFVTPVIVGGGTPALPGGTRASLDLVGERLLVLGLVDREPQWPPGAALPGGYALGPCEIRTMLPEGSRNAQSRGPQDWSIGSWSTSAPDARTFSKVASTSSVRKTVIGRTPLVSSSCRASPSAWDRPACGSESTISRTGWAALPRVTQRNPTEATSLRTSRPSASP